MIDRLVDLAALEPPDKVRLTFKTIAHPRCGLVSVLMAHRQCSIQFEPSQVL